jgi:tetratricopeptide (TPR) repeat protein
MAEKEASFLTARSAANPGSFQTWAQLAAVYVKLGRITGETSYYVKAKDAAQRSLKIFPRPNAIASLALAQVAAAGHRFEEAIRIAKDVSNESTNPVGAGSVLTTAYLAKGDLEEAAREAERLVEVKPALGTYSLRALVMGAMGRTAESIEDFENALRVEDFGEEDESAWVRSLYARQLMRVGRYTDAEKVLSSALEMKPGYHLALDLEGQLALLKGDPALAERNFGGALHESMQVIYLARLARAKVGNGEQAAGLKLLKQAEGMIRTELKSGGFGHRLELAKILLYRAKLEETSRAALVAEAEALAHEELSVRGTSDAWLTYARACRGEGGEKVHEAARAVREALLTGGSESEAFHEASLIELELSNPRRAAFFARRALETNPKFSPERSVEL